MTEGNPMSRADADPNPFAEDLQPLGPQVATPLPGFHGRALLRARCARARGFLEVSDQILDYYATPWRSPWPVLAEAERLRQAACNRPQGPCA